MVAGRLDRLGSALTVVFGGGVLRARHPVLVDPIVGQLTVAAPRATVTVDAPPVLGAALSALDPLGADALAHATHAPSWPTGAPRPPGG